MSSAAPLFCSHGAGTSLLTNLITSMFRYNTTAAVLALAALSAPMVCQAQDPNASLAQVQKLAGANKTDEALKLCDQVIKRFGGETNLAKQFAYVLPFYYWEKANIYAKVGMYDEAVATYKDLSTNPRWRQPSMLNAAKANLPGKEGGYTPLLTNSIFQMGYCRYKQAVGTDDKPGDPSKFDEAIQYLDQYLKLLKSGKVSETEKRQKVDGQVCFLLMQSCLLKPQPDFQKANEYLEQSSAGKSKLPDDMAMNGLASVVKVACENPQYINWIYKIIDSSPASFNLGALRSARFSNKFLNMGLRVAKVVDEALAKNEVKMATEAMRSVNALFSLVPDVVAIEEEAEAMVKSMGKYNRPLPDPAVGVKYVPDVQKKVLEAFRKVAKDKMFMEGYTVISTANVAYNLGSPRLAKAGYQVAVDHYPTLSRKDKKGLTSMKDANIYQLAQFCYATGDEAAGTKYEKMLEGKELGDNAKNLTFNKMRRAIKDHQWERVVELTHDVMRDFSSDKSGRYYVTAQFAEVAALFKLQKYDDVIKQGKGMLEGGNLVAQEGKLKPEEVGNYERQLMFYIMDAYIRLAKSDPTNLDKALEYFKMSTEKYPSLDLKENNLVANLYYDAIDALLKRRGHGNEAANAKDMEEALKYCAVIEQNWPEHDIYPRAALFAGSILINGSDESRKQEGIDNLEKCADAALKQEDKSKGQQVAANALFWLASYSPELPREGETPEALAARVQGYVDRFWKDSDFEGNVYALPMASLQVSRARKGKDVAQFDAAVEKAREIIAREANVAFKAGKGNPELEKTINTYAESYMEGMKALHDKTLTLEEKVAHFSKFPGIDPEDKYTNAILRMSLVSAMNQELAAIKDDEAAKSKLTDDVERTFREMTNEFQPGDLTNYICVQVGDYLVKYVSRFDNPSSKVDEIKQAVAYYDQVLDRGQDMLGEAKLGKARALALSADAADKKASAELYKGLADVKDTAVAGPALIGLAENHMAMGAYQEAIDVANKFIKNRRLTQNRLDMYLLLGQAYSKAGNIKDALLAYMNIYNQNRGNIGYSAPACMAMMELMWNRNEEASGDRLKGDYKSSDRWTAWRTGQDFINQIQRSNLLGKLAPADRDKYNALVQLVGKYGADPSVQKEERSRKEFESRLNNK